MYTKQRADVWKNHWYILDPDGDEICTVIGADDADKLLSHLNR